jgi:oligopeptide transport system substrate-binding protein
VLFICLVVLIAGLPLGLARGADPVTATLLMPPVTGLDPVNLSPADRGGRDLVENLFAGLVRLDPATNTVQPMLARTWAVSSDGLTWRFTLRTDVQWVRYDASGGQVKSVRPVVAGDFVYGIRRACDPAAPNPVAHTVYIIAGCRTIATADPLLIDDVFIARELGVRVVNAQTLDINLLFPAPYFPALLTKPEFRPVPREAVTQAGDWTQPGSLISSGPWVMAARDAASLTLIRNPLWPDAPTGNVERISALFSSSPEDMLAQFTAGRADFARLDLVTAAALDKAIPGAAPIVPGPKVTLLGFSAERAITGNVALRQALALSIDRASLVDSLFPGAALPTWRITPPGAIGGPTDPPDNRGFMPAAAKTALGAARAANCRFGEALDLMVENTPQMTALAAALVAQWQANLGCSPTAFTIRPVTAQALERVANGTFSTIRSTDPARPYLWLYSWAPDYADLNAWAGDGIHCRYGYIRSGVPCGEADSLVDSAAVESDPALRLDAYNRAEALWFGPTGTFPVAPLFVSLEALGRQPWLQGTTVNGAAWFDAWTIKR